MRKVNLEPQPGSLYLAEMPGRNHPFASDSQEIIDQAIDAVIALAGLDETRHRSPQYAAAIEAGALPFTRQEFAIPDYGVPADRNAYLELAQQAAAALRRGESRLIHCGAGIGRTGTLAVRILVELGFALDEAVGRVEAAGSGPETDEQRALVAWRE